MQRKRSWLPRIIGALVFAVAAAALVMLPSCTTPSGKFATPQAIVEMSEEDFALYLDRVGAWATVAGEAAVKQGADHNKVLAYCVALEAITDPVPGSLGAAAAQAGLDSPIAQLLVIEAEALLRARGGLPGGPRGLALLNKVAHSVMYGVSAARNQIEASQ